MNSRTRLNLVYAFSATFFLLAPLPSHAAKSKGFVAGPQYFYPVLQDSSDVNTAYQIPECAKLADAEYKKIKRQCEAMGENAKRCPTEKTVTVEAGAHPTQSTKDQPNEEVMKEAQKVEPTTKTMKLSYIVFVSLDECKQTREHELEGD